MLSVTRASKLCAPATKFVRVKLYGDVVAVPALTPLRNNSTFDTVRPVIVTFTPTATFVFAVKEARSAGLEKVTNEPVPVGPFRSVNSFNALPSLNVQFGNLAFLCKFAPLYCPSINAVYFFQ